MYTKKHRKKSRQTKFWKLVRLLVILYSCYNFALALNENALVFSQSEARNFILYIYILLRIIKSLVKSWESLIACVQRQMRFIKGSIIFLLRPSFVHWQKICKNLLCWGTLQVAPSQNFAQTQSGRPFTTKHVPPFRHGEVRHYK